MAGAVVILGGGSTGEAFATEAPIATLRDTIQPYPTFSEAVFFAVRDLPL